jgi:hypothetical protein
VYGNPINLVDAGGLLPSLPQWLVDGAAGFGDTLSFGLTDKVRDWMGTNGTVNKCSGGYTGGQAGAIGFSLALGGVHLGRHAANVGFKQFFRDPRRYGTVQKKWSKSVGGYKGKYQLHHWFTAQSAGGTSAGWNLVAVSSKFNNMMGNGGFLFNAFKAAYIGVNLGAVGSIPTAISQNQYDSGE